MKNYKLLLEAVRDLENLADWGWDNWGEEKTLTFIQGFYARFEWLREHYELARIFHTIP